MHFLLVLVTTLFAVDMHAFAVPSKVSAALFRRTDDSQESRLTESSEISNPAQPDLLVSGSTSESTFDSPARAQEAAAVQNYPPDQMLQSDTPPVWPDAKDPFWCGYSGLLQCCSNMEDSKTCEKCMVLYLAQYFDSLFA